MKLARLGDIAEFINGVAFKPEDWGSEGRKIIRIQNLTDPSKPYNYTTRQVDDKYVVQKGDVLVSWSATIDVFTWDDDEALVNQHIFKVVFDTSKVQKFYFIFALKKTIDELSKFAHGSTMKHVVKKDFDNHRIPLPDLDDQLRISNILSKAESLISQRKESLRLLDELLKSTFLEMFGDPGMNSKSWGEVPMIGICKDPHDIKCGPFGTQLSKAEFTSKGIALWGIPQINSLFKVPPKDFVTEEKAMELEQYALTSGDIAMSRKGNVGKCCIYPKVLAKGIMHSDVLRIRAAKDKINPLYLLYQLRFSKRVEDQISAVSKGAVMAGINVGKLKNMMIQTPPIKLQTQFGHFVEKTESLKAHYQASLQELENLYGALSQRAFRGELMISKSTVGNEAQG